MMRHIFRSDETMCHKSGHYLPENFLPVVAEMREKFYYKMLNDSNVSQLEASHKQTVLEGLRRSMCVEKAFNISSPLEISEDCEAYTGR